MEVDHPADFDGARAHGAGVERRRRDEQHAETHVEDPQHLVERNLAEVTLKYARRLALIAPEALYATKLAINRGADAGGFHGSLNAGLDIVAPLYAARTEVGQRFNEITRKDGLGAALKWRAAQFAE
jgi:hypothetical protein